METIGPQMGRYEHEEFGEWCEEQGGDFTHNRHTNPDIGSHCKIGRNSIIIGGKYDDAEVTVEGELTDDINRFSDLGRESRGDGYRWGDRVHVRMTDVEIELDDFGMDIMRGGKEILSVDTTDDVKISGWDKRTPSYYKKFRKR